MSEMLGLFMRTFIVLTLITSVSFCDLIDPDEPITVSDQIVSESADLDVPSEELENTVETTAEEAMIIRDGYDPRKDYKMRPGDTISVTMLEDEEIRFDGEISISGLIPLKHIGNILIAGKSADDAEKFIKNEFEEKFYQEATISLSVIKRAAGHIYVYGSVKQPGKIELPPVGDMDIIQAITEAGGPTPYSKPSETKVYRKGGINEERRVMHVDLDQAFKDLTGEGNISLIDNDVVVVPSMTGKNTIFSNDETEVIVTGQVEHPGLVAFQPGEQCTFIRAIFKAGSFTRFAHKRKVKLIQYNDGNREVSEIDAERMIEEGFLDDDIDLSPGDMIIVPEKMFNLR